jgi:hypothetical protein
MPHMTLQPRVARLCDRIYRVSRARVGPRGGIEVGGALLVLRFVSNIGTTGSLTADALNVLEFLDL